MPQSEKADELARKEASTPLVGLETFCGIGYVFFKEDSKDLIATRRYRLWRERKGLRQFNKLLGGCKFKCQEHRSQQNQTKEYNSFSSEALPAEIAIEQS